MSMKTTFESLGLALLLVGATAAMAEPMHADSHRDSRSTLVYDMPIQELDPIVMESTRGGLGPMALALGIASVDLALMGFYWGVYVPYYAPTTPHFYTETP